MSSCAVAARAIITCLRLDIVECAVRRAYVRRWGSEFAAVESVSDNSSPRSARTISFNKTLPSFVSLICSTSQFGSTADSRLSLLLQRHRQACNKLANCCLNRRIELTSSVYRGVPNWRQGPGNPVSTTSLSTATTYAYLLKTFTSRDVHLESFPAPLCEC